MKLHCFAGCSGSSHVKSQESYKVGEHGVVLEAILESAASLCEPHVISVVCLYVEQ